MAKTRVLLAEHQTAVRQGLRRILESDGEIEIVGEVGDGGGAVEAAQRPQPHAPLGGVAAPSPSSSSLSHPPEKPVRPRRLEGLPPA